MSAGSGNGRGKGNFLSAEGIFLQGVVSEQKQRAAAHLESRFCCSPWKTKVVSEFFHSFFLTGLRIKAIPPRIRAKARIKGKVIVSLRKSIEKAVAQKALR